MMKTSVSLHDRRSFLKTLGATGSLAALGVAGGGVGLLSASTLNKTQRKNVGHYAFAVGEFEAFVISDGSALFPSRPTFAPEVSDEEVLGLLKEHRLPVEKTPFFFNVMLVNTGAELALIDTGAGAALGEGGGRLLAALEALNVKPANISSIFLTHAHFDHFGGLLTSDGKPVFPAAKVYAAAEEVEFWMGKSPDLSGLRAAPDAAARKGFIEGARRVFDGLKKQLVAVKPNTKLPDGFAMELAPGHTAGHAMVRVKSGGEELLNFGDLVHHHVLMFEKPDWTFAYDSVPEQARATRKSLFPKLVAQGTRVFGYHLPFPAIGRVRSLTTDSYRWEPEPWSFTV